KAADKSAAPHKTNRQTRGVQARLACTYTSRGFCMIGQEKKPALGRGLSSLIPAARATAPVAAPSIQAVAAPGETIQQIAVGEIDSNPFQTRIAIDEKSIDELAESIKMQGILQPIVLR